MHALSALTPAPDPAATIAVQLWRLKTVMQCTGLCRSSIYKLLSQAQFPAPVQLVGRAVAWRRSDIEAWMLSRPTVAH